MNVEKGCFMNIEKIVLNEKTLDFCSYIYDVLNISNEELNDLSKINSKLNVLLNNLNSDRHLVVLLAYELFLLKYVVRKDVSSLGINGKLLEKSNRYRQELSIKRMFNFFFLEEGLFLDIDIKKWILNGILTIGNYDLAKSKFDLKIDNYTSLIIFNKSLILDCLDDVGYSNKSNVLMNKSDINALISDNDFFTLYNKKYNYFILNQQELIKGINNNHSYKTLSIYSKLIDIYDRYIKFGNFFLDDLAFFKNYEKELFEFDSNLVAIYDFLISFMNEFDLEVINNCKKSVVLKV